jgi:hypothetical protein
MPSASSARLKGDDFQHLFAWLHSLELLMPQQQVARVIIEDAKAVSADDVTLLRDPGAYPPDRYHQIKFHVDLSKGYSVEVLKEQKNGESSLLQKWFKSWETITAGSARPLEIIIVSNWPWVPRDGLGQFIDGETNALKDEFFTATGKTKAATVRADLAKHVGTTVSRFDEFARTLRFKLGYDCWRDMTERAAERMMYHGLKSDETALLIVVSFVRGWVKAGRQEITRADLEAIIDKHVLWLSPEARPSVNIYLVTIKQQQFDIPAQHTLDWRQHFVAGPGVRGHVTTDPADWNDKMLPELRDLEANISSQTTDRLIRARGLSRLSAWFAFGHVFCDVAGYTIEMDQQGQLWQTDAPPSTDFMLTSNGPGGLLLDPDGKTVAVAVSVGADLEPDVRRHLDSRTDKVKAALFIRPTRGLDRHCLRNAGDAVALADRVKEAMREFVKYHQARQVLLYYHGPIAGACFIGHRLNAVCREVQIMEWSDPNYVPSFTLTW